MADVESMEATDAAVKSPTTGTAEDVTFTKNLEESSEDASDDDLKKGVHEEEEDPGAHLPLREFKVQLPGMKEPICFNPLVSGIGVVFLWGLSIWSMVSVVCCCFGLLCFVFCFSCSMS